MHKNTSLMVLVRRKWENDHKIVLKAFNNVCNWIYLLIVNQNHHHHLLVHLLDNINNHLISSLSSFFYPSFIIAFFNLLILGQFLPYSSSLESPSFFTSSSSYLLDHLLILTLIHPHQPLHSLSYPLNQLPYICRTFAKSFY